MPLRNPAVSRKFCTETPFHQHPIYNIGSPFPTAKIFGVKNILKHLWSSFREELPRLGRSGSRATMLSTGDYSDVPTKLGPHDPYQGGSTFINTATGTDLIADSSTSHSAVRSVLRSPGTKGSTLTFSELHRFARIRWLGTIGALLLGLGGLGAGALPVVGNPYTGFPAGSLMSRMLQTSMIMCFIGVGFIVVAWLLMAPFVGVINHHSRHSQTLVSVSLLRRTFAAWSLPILLSAPMFTQDIYSYIANGRILKLGLDPYSAGPVDLLGADNPLARSVPFIWAHSPSPYGPVALGLAKVISIVTDDSIVWSVFCHRALSIAGIALAGWAISRLAIRCRVFPQAALWLGLLNPLTILHLVGGIHNEAILLGLLLAGFEVGLRACTLLSLERYGLVAFFLFLSITMISSAGMVKVTGFIGLGFIGMAFARALYLHGFNHWKALSISTTLHFVGFVASIAFVTLVSGISLGWVTGQGGAVSIRSWMSISTAIGVIFGWFGMLLGLGDHTEAILVVTRAAGIFVALAAMVRMLVATYVGRIAAIGGLGVSTFILVICFPVVHPWYMLWAILPLAAWANRRLFRYTVIGYSALLSFFVLPRGLSLPPVTVLSIYLGSITSFIIFVLFVRWIFNRR